MSEREPDTADVRPFLPRPGEPVEEYAERLRAMHRDLSVVLQAVERGLERSHEHEPGPIVRVPDPEPATAPVAAPAGLMGPGTARVEVVHSGRGHRAEDEAVDEDWVEEEPALPPPPGPERRHSRARPLADRPSQDPSRGGGQDPWPPAAPPLAERPSGDPHRGWPEPALAPPPPRPGPPAFTPASYPTHWADGNDRRRGPLLPGWAIAAILAGWLTIVALLLALLIEA
jgi:hypothetical protein